MVVSNNTIAVFNSFRGGYVHPDVISRFELDPDECQDCLNVYCLNDGNLQKRYGLTQFNSGGVNQADDVLDLMEYYDGSAGNKYLVWRQNLDIYQASSGDDTGTVRQISGDSAYDGATSINKLDHTTLNDKLYITVADGDAETAMLILDGTTLSADAAIFADVDKYPKFITSFNNRLVGLGQNHSTDEPNLLMWTDIGASGYEDSMEIGPTDGDVCTGLVRLGTGLLVTKENSCYFVAEIGSFPYVEQIQIPVGCVSFQTIVETPDGIMLLAKDGVWHISRTLKFTWMSRQVQPLLDALSMATLRDAKAVYHNNRYYLSYKGDGSSYNTMLMLDRNIAIKKKHRKEHYNPWWIWDIAAPAMTVWKMYDNQIYWGHSDGTITTYDTDTYEDNGTDIESYWESGELDFGYPQFNKVFDLYRIDKRMLTGNLTISWTLDDGYLLNSYNSAAAAAGSQFGDAQFGTATFGGELAIQDSIPMTFGFNGRHLKIRFYEQSSNKPWTVLSHGIEYQLDSIYRS